MIITSADMKQNVLKVAWSPIPMQTVTDTASMKKIKANNLRWVHLGVVGEKDSWNLFYAQIIQTLLQNKLVQCNLRLN